MGKANKIEIIQKIKPIKTGNLKINGMITKCFNMTGFHPTNAKGIAHNYLEKHGEKGLTELPSPQMNLHEIEIFEQQPDMKVYINFFKTISFFLDRVYGARK